MNWICEFMLPMLKPQGAIALDSSELPFDNLPGKKGILISVAASLG